MSWRVVLFFLAAVMFATAGSFVLGWWASSNDILSGASGLLSPLKLSGLPSPVPRPLLEYSFDNLAQRRYRAAPIRITKTLALENTFRAYEFEYLTMGKPMSGRLTVPVRLDPERPAPVVVMVRGFVPPEIYQPGVGTRRAAEIFAEAGLVTLAPDFFGFGNSAPEPVDPWEARFVKPINIIELLKSVEQFGVTSDDQPFVAASSQLGLWGHSNGGQIALSVLEILQQPYPTSLWAPVTAPFPYSILFFSDEHDDEGKAARAWLAEFEQVYDVFEFSLTRHLDRLVGPIQLHHGGADQAALKEWSDELVDKVAAENDRRLQIMENRADGLAVQSAADNVPSPGTATNSADGTQLTDGTPAALLEPIELTYFEYPGADHNLQPDWNTVVARDIAFFEELLGS
ncbi:MAG: hypothetical protein COU69_00230 [Candidatus Pacebacteria bacterium CG10_big_fil_rev_8_21_14_0_10_56_10]|nr:MAG: hypothetical protein COU69_00230 [Candidatus Pacebacteria bacterium CG10_big_fil_rev_8_21_14_0_10_56_10]